MDVAAVDIRHVRLDEEGRYVEEIKSGLDNCLAHSANVDQTGRLLIQDGVLSMLDEGAVAFVPVDTSSDISAGSFSVESIRTGKVTSWYPDSVKVSLYNERVGRRQEVVVPKASVAIVENPFYTVINEPNSTLQRLVRKLALLDVVDQQSGSNSLDLIIQLPYTVKSPLRKEQAEQRRAELEAQLKDSKYGVGYIDGTERVTQLNRPVENNLLKQVEYLTNLLFSQLGITQEVLAGTANENAMNNYYTRTIEPILLAITEEMERKFLTQTARTQGQAIRFFRDPFRLIPTSQVAEMADKLIRNEVTTKNEMRSAIGLRPIEDPAADTLYNPNMPTQDQEIAAQPVEFSGEEPTTEEGQNG